MSLRVVVAEDHALLREGLRSLIRSSDGIDLLAACSDLTGLLAAIDEHRPDVVLTDIRMPPGRTRRGGAGSGVLPPPAPAGRASCCSASTSTLDMCGRC